jgi:hypothetical protein
MMLTSTVGVGNLFWRFPFVVDEDFALKPELIIAQTEFAIAQMELKCLSLQNWLTLLSLLPAQPHKNEIPPGEDHTYSAPLFRS